MLQRIAYVRGLAMHVDIPPGRGLDDRYTTFRAVLFLTDWGFHLKNRRFHLKNRPVVWPESFQVLKNVFDAYLFRGNVLSDQNRTRLVNIEG